MTADHSPRFKKLTLASVLMLAVGLFGCAPEAGDIAGSTDKDTQTINPESEASEREVSDYEFTHEIPESFPADLFKFPDTAVIQDVGESGVDRWFVVFVAPDAASADELWNEIIERNGFGVTEESETVEGGPTATLTGAAITVEAAAIPNPDGTELLSYVLTRWA